ncbi:MAG: hypothetical protein KY476_17845, partial [Planctomycetes bacterium]|nr:hypothetical protein [Planctomycetota bacterium]
EVVMVRETVRLVPVVLLAVAASATADDVTLNRKDTGYRGIWYFNQKSGDEYVYKYSGGLGTYCAKHQPFAVYSREADYARRPVNAHPEFYALWADGHGREPSLSNIYFCNREGTVFRLPRSMDGDFARPEVVPVPLKRPHPPPDDREPRRSIHPGHTPARQCAIP